MGKGENGGWRRHSDRAPRAFEATLLARAGEDLLIVNPHGPNLVLAYGNGSASITHDAIRAYWTVDTIYLGFGGQLPGEPRHAVVIFVQPAQRGLWQVHCQITVRSEDCSGDNLPLAA